MKWTTLAELIEEPIDGEWGTAEYTRDNTEAVKVLKMVDFYNFYKIDSEYIPIRYVSRSARREKQLRSGDIVIERISEDEDQLVGQPIYFEEKDERFLSDNYTTIFRTNGKVDSKYLFYFLLYNYKKGGTKEFFNETNKLKSLKLRHFMETLKIPIFDREIEKKIVLVLDEINSLIKLRKQQMALTDKFMESLFYEMFLKKNRIDSWKTFKIEDLILNPGKDVNKKIVDPISYIDGNNLDNLMCDMKIYKNYSQIEDFSHKTGKNVNQGDIILSMKRPYLKNMAIFNMDTKYRPMVSTEFCVLSPKKELNNAYLFSFLKSEQITHYLNRVAKGIECPTVREKDILSIDIPLAPMSIQHKYALRFEEVEAQKKEMKRSLVSMENMYMDLSQRAFSGELE